MTNHQDHPNHALYRFSAGDMIALLDLIPCDEMETLSVPGQGSVTLARCGRVHIMATTEGGRLDAHAHDNAEEAADCYQFALTHFRNMIDAGSAAGPSRDARTEAVINAAPPPIREAIRRALADGRVTSGPATGNGMPPAVQAALDQLRAVLPPDVELIEHTVRIDPRDLDNGMEGGYL